MEKFLGEENEIEIENENSKPEVSNQLVISLLHRMAGPSSGKAGLNQIDKASIDKKIYELSKGSKFFENEKRKDEKLTLRINDMLEKHKKLTMVDLSSHLPYLAKLEKEIEMSRDLSQIIVHVDMDAFYAAVEELDDPSLKGIPVGVGGLSMLSTANYVARKFGVRSAMPGFIAKELCPTLKIVPCRFNRYIEISNQVKKVFVEYDPGFRSVSLDEAYLNLTTYCEENNISASDAVSRLREQIFTETKLTASAGIGCNKLLAKIASDYNKPNGQYIVPSERDRILEFISPLPIRKIFGIGRVTERVLNSIGIKKCEDIYANQLILHSLLYEKTFSFIFKACLGIASNDLESYGPRKSIGCERTFNVLSSLEDLQNKLKELALSLSKDVERKNLKGKTVTLKIKTPGFEVRVKSKTFKNYISTYDELLDAGNQILIKEYPISMRLMGLRLSNFCDESIDQGNTNSILKYLNRKDENGIMQSGNNNLKRDSTLYEQDEGVISDLESDDYSNGYSSDEEVNIKSNNHKYYNTSKDEVSGDNISVEPVPEVFECPICMKKYINRFTNLVQINQHIDSCLTNQKEIKTKVEMTKKDLKLPKKVRSNSKPKGDILNFFNKSE